MSAFLDRVNAARAMKGVPPLTLGRSTPNYIEKLLGLLAVLAFTLTVGLALGWAYNQLAELWHWTVLTWKQIEAVWVMVLTIRWFLRK